MAVITRADNPRMVVRYKPDDETVNNSATLQNDDDLVFDVAANEVWAFEAFLVFLSSNATPDFKLHFTFPTGSENNWVASANILDSSPAAAGVGGGEIDSALGPISFPFSNGFAWAVQVRGSVVAGATAGQAQLQWAQVNATEQNTTLRAGSYLVATKLA